jgi:hypothetical protein
MKTTKETEVNNWLVLVAVPPGIPENKSRGAPLGAMKKQFSKPLLGIEPNSPPVSRLL